ncbi:MAG: UvrD-helicase domain-containing protein [Coriobacteriia bacterium]|nr:UvrD-helicase domain-containing protein [Coriobacteriia bacterium]MCL2871220.1 UvrD-helicase domain-containing protein [Coriobacteriia bacterium]
MNTLSLFEDTDHEEGHKKADSTLDLSQLNDAQREAVLHTEGPLLVLAGAGSGKTRVLTYRITHMVADLGVAPWQILAITFTNKAAGEMRERITQQLGDAARSMWISTYHAACVRILRAEAEVLGYKRSFTIYDDDDAKRLIKDIMRELEVDPQVYPIATIRNRISKAKNELQLPEDLPEFGAAPLDRLIRTIYTRYAERLLAANAMDFDDLLFNVARLFTDYEEVLERYQQRFRYLLVDEYQDTNHAQYLITKLLAAKHRNLMVVGDDDQSIYSWRGADLSNILEFERDYPEAHTVKLEQNYRSTANILDAANALVSNNSKRKDKQLFTDNDPGELISLYLASNEHDEARYIAAEIERIARRESRKHSDFAIFYRTNAQSRVLEDALLRAGLGYRIVGGTRYFDRAEIRDLMAYLKVVVNSVDDISLMRIINMPRRGIGSTSIQAVQALAYRERLSFEQALRAAVSDAPEAANVLRPAAQKAITAFIVALDEMRSYRGELARVVEAIINASGLLAHFESQHTDEAAGRAENIREFVNVAAEFEATHADSVLAAAEVEEADQLAQSGVISDIAVDGLVGDVPIEGDVSTGNELLFAFMEWLALRSDLDSLGGESETVTMMTVHTAKGLEYPVVLVAGMEESLFPHANSVYDSSGLEEERRLAYVAITRARERLVLTRAAGRMSFGTPAQNPPSRFLSEIPEELLHTQGVGSDGFAGASGWDKRGDRRGVAGHGISHGQRSGDNYGGSYSSGSSYGEGSSSRGSRGEGSSRSIYDSEPVSYGSGMPKTKDTFAVGDTVNHKMWGRGKVMEVNGDSLTINFESKGVKKLMAGFAPIVKIQ